MGVRESDNYLHFANDQDTTFTYGADDLRRSMTVMQSGSSLTTNYVYDGTMMIREMQVVTGSLVSSATYFQGASGPAYRRNDLNGSIPSWYVYNGLGSVVGEVDPSGNYIASQEYDVYGAVRASTQTGSFNTRQGYVGGLGHQTDPETGGLIYMQARYYDPGVGRFTSEDPSKNGENWFNYGLQDPVNNVDADGKMSTAAAFELAGYAGMFIFSFATSSLFRGTLGIGFLFMLGSILAPLAFVLALPVVPFGLLLGASASIFVVSLIKGVMSTCWSLATSEFPASVNVLGTPSTVVGAAAQISDMIAGYAAGLYLMMAADDAVESMS